MMVNGDRYVTITGLALMLTLPVDILDSCPCLQSD